MKAKLLFLTLTLVLSLLVTGVTLANNDVVRSRWVLGGGASDAASAAGGVALHATLGQPVVGVVTGAGGNVTLGQGFWNGAIAEHTVYLPLVTRG